VWTIHRLLEYPAQTNQTFINQRLTNTASQTPATLKEPQTKIAMKTLNRINPMRNCLHRLATVGSTARIASSLAVLALASLPAHAAPTVWNVNIGNEITTSDTTYKYTVTARDKSPAQNETTPSTAESATTDPADNTAPTPDPMSFDSPPATSSITKITKITMTATTASDISGVEYYFTETSGNPGGSDSGWQDSPVYTDGGLPHLRNEPVRHRGENGGIAESAVLMRCFQALNRDERAVFAEPVEAFVKKARIMAGLAFGPKASAPEPSPHPAPIWDNRF
jgi:hypothetical protein